MSLLVKCRLGPLVAMFKYSKVATYSVSLTPEKLEFGNSVRGEVLKEEFEDVSIFKCTSDFSNGTYILISFC